MGISQCLLGDRVRYDGAGKAQDWMIEQISKYCTLLKICPEVEAGMSIPRPPFQLQQHNNHIRLIGRDNPDLDVTEQMQVYCQKKVCQLQDLHGFIFKSRSPSCGWRSTPLYAHGKPVDNEHSGIFARHLLEHIPNLIIAEETGLQSPAQCKDFIHRVTALYHDRKQQSAN